jgi:dTDP-4-dehydrorhamnose reductase
LRVLVTGASGMVGRAVVEHCREAGDEVLGRDHTGLNIADWPSVVREFQETLPAVAINCAAWTDVDGCERDPERSHAANATGPQNLAAAAAKSNSVFVTISTDYVFAGDKEGFYTQDDEPKPISVYGKSKLQGEEEACAAYSGTIVVRTGFIFGPGGRNFLSKIGGPLREGKQVGAISDAWGTPTYAIHLARRLRELAQLNRPGIYHVVNDGAGASYEEFARFVSQEVGADTSLVSGVLSATLNRPAPRPRNSRLKCLVSPVVGLAPLPDWRVAVREYLSSS